MVAYLRYPGRWSVDSFVAATRVPGIFEDITPEEAAYVLDQIEATVQG